jgi:hypothetical protein
MYVNERFPYPRFGITTVPKAKGPVGFGRTLFKRPIGICDPVEVLIHSPINNQALGNAEGCARIEGMSCHVRWRVHMPCNVDAVMLGTSDFSPLSSRFQNDTRLLSDIQMSTTGCQQEQIGVPGMYHRKILKFQSSEASGFGRRH